MNAPRSFVFFATLCLAIALGGCKSSNPSATNSGSQPTQPAQTAQQPAPAGQPAASSATPSATPGQAGAPAAGQAAPAAGQAMTAAPPPPPPPPAAIILPAGTHLHVRLDTDLGSAISHAGDSFRATVADDVVENGTVVIPRHARAEGLVVDAKPLGHFKGGALLSLRLERVHTKFGSYPVATSSIERAEQGKGKRSAGFIGGGAGLGAIIGGIAGGGKGAAIGALAGGGAGTAGAGLTGNKQIVLPAETLLTFRLEHSVHITPQAPEPPAPQDPTLQQR